MKKLLLLVSIALLAGIGYFSYEKWIKYADVTPWSFVPSDAAVVFDFELLEDYSALKEYTFWENLGETKGIRRIDDGISFLDSLNGNGGFSAIFKSAPTLVSMHKVSSETFDFLFVLDIENISQNTFVSAAIGRLKERGYRFRTRNYNGFKISEVVQGSEVFTCIFYKNFLLASFTPYLVEDAIRTIEGEQQPFRGLQGSLQSAQPSSIFDVYVNYAMAGRLVSGIASNSVSLPFTTGDYALSMDSSFISVSGFSDVERTSLLTHRTNAAAFDMAEVIPENTAYLYHISSSDFPQWKTQQMEYLTSNEPEIKKIQDSLISLFDFRADQVLDLVDEEIGLVRVESGSSEERNLCILELKDTQESLDFFQNLTERIAISLDDTVYSESYSENEIRYLPIRQFPQTFLGSIAGSFDQCFYINHRNYLIFSNNLQELKSVVSAIQNEDTWGKSLRVNEFLLRTNNTANFSLYVNIPRSLNKIKTQLNSSWSTHLEDHLSAYQNFEYAAFQFSSLDDRFFTNFTFSQPTKVSKSIPKTNPESGLRFASNLITKPHLLRTHAYKDLDILIQDSTNAIYYLDPNQNTLWTQDVEGKIISNIYPIDYYKNGKVQYAFATKQSVHIWDRTGQPIPGYPQSLSSTAIQHFSVIDYDLSRNYRMAVTDEEGNTYLTTKELKVLDGWKPKKFQRSSIQPLRHQRLGRRDVMISLQQDGVVNVTNRRAVNMPGFPFDTKQNLDANYFLKTSNGLSNSSITMISKNGELIELSMEGAVIQRNQLLRTSANATFSLIPDRNNKSFLVVRKDGNKYEILDDTGNLLFSKDYFTEGEIIIQYYEFGAGRDIIVFTDPFSETLFIYDKAGNLLTGNPLKSAHEVSILYSSTNREFQVYSTSGSNLELYSFTY